MSSPNGSSVCPGSPDRRMADPPAPLAESGWTLVASGLAFPEAPRWHHDALWFSDIFDRRVKRVGALGGVTAVVDVPAGPSGLGWRRDGTLLVVSMADRRLLAFDGTSCRLEADLSHVATGPANDMVVAPSGLAYVGNFGYDYEAGAQRAAAHLAMVDLEGRVHDVADDLWFPNGMAITADGATLLVAETSASRVSSFAIGADGGLGDRRTWADLGTARPDGISLDAEGALWVASPGTREILRLPEGGRVLDSLGAPGEMGQACVLGGTDGRTLFVCSAPTHDRAESLRDRSGSIWSRTVYVPAASL
jgi:sugar lactone lactonase YvrE